MTVDLSPKRTAAAPPFLTVVPYRNVREKVHATPGQAMSAITSRMHYWGTRATAPTPAAVYVNRSGAWTLLWSCQTGDDITGEPWKAAIREAAAA